MINSLRDAMRNALRSKPTPTLDSVGGKGKKFDKAGKKGRRFRKTFDDAGDDDVADAADEYTSNDIALKAAAALQQWVETDDLDEGETLSNRLMGQIIGIADGNQDGEVDDDEQSVIDIALNAAWDYLSKYGVDDDDIEALLADWDEDVAQRVRDLLATALPDGEEAAADDINDFVFGDDDDQAAALDSTNHRHSSRALVKKRITGHVKLSAKHKLAIRKTHEKTHHASAQMRRKK